MSTGPDTTASQSKPTGARRRARDRITAAERRREREAVQRRAVTRRLTIRAVIGTVVTALVVGGLYLLFLSSTEPPDSSDGASNDRFQVGSPGIGETAPDFTLPDTTGQHVQLSSLRGKSVLLYFHEGLGCQPCFDQIRDLEKATADLTSAGIDELLTITTAPTDQLAQKMTDDKLTATALSDTDLAVSRQYQANKYGMMGEDRDGHTFILVGPDGRIQWRADYGGAPNYTMYVPVKTLLADLDAGRRP